MADELIDIVEEQGIVVRQAMKSEAHVHGWLHKTVIGCIPYRDGMGLVRQAADRQDAGQLVMPVGGHVMAAEDSDQALIRECEEEIGTSDVTFRYIGTKIFRRNILGRDENHMFILYELIVNGALQLGDEAIEYREFTKAELKNHLRDHPSEFGDAFYFMLEHFYPGLLPKSYRQKHRS